MKKIITQIVVGLLAVAAARAETALSLTANYGCLTDLGPNPEPNPPTVIGSFNLSGVSGSGIVQSRVGSYYYANFQDPNLKDYVYSYSIDLSGLSPAANHCVKLVIHFGTPVACSEPAVACDPGRVQSAALAPFGDITFVFAGGCLNPGQPAVTVGMASPPVPFKTNVVTIIDDYVSPASGQTNETRINVPALVPDIPPDPPPWVYYHPITFPYPFFQGSLDLVGTNQVSTNSPPITTATNGSYDFTLQLMNAPSNGLAVSQVTTQTVQVVNGLFNIPLPFDPISMGDGSDRWLSIGVRPSYTGGTFSELVPAVRVAPTPQALYAYSAGVVADLTPGQAVTSLNGLTDGVTLAAGLGISISTDGGHTLTISAQPGGPSDRNLKTDITAVNPETILTKLTAMPIETWRFTNEVAGIRHVGPMAQDFKAAFGLGDNDKIIGYLDASGVALAAIQGLNQRVEEQDQELKQKQTEITDLKQRLEELKQVVNQLNQKIGGGDK